MPGRAPKRARAAAPPVPAEPGRRERSKLEKLDRIRVAAHRLFGRQGFAATTTKQIASAADIGSGTLFLYAPTKEDLLVLIFQEEVGLAVDAAFASVPDEPILGQVMHVLNAIIAHHAADPALARVFVKELPFVDSRNRGVATFMQQMNARLAALIERAKERGELDPDVPATLLARNLFASFFQYVQICLGTRASELEVGDVQLRAALDLQLRGARRQPVRARGGRS
jgi:AcrR family transcriptional regulator